ncbi:flavodoxin family protein [Dietzia maris]|uniref:flavodoxin family protein n=1 Tax=Dietzia maris TaxID=37915 RepID=UPI00342A87A1
MYESAWGNTRLVAEAISDGLSPHLTAEVVAAHEAPPLAELTVDLLVVGAPTHAFGLPRDGTREDAHARGGELIPSGVREWLDAAGPASLAVATFDTHVRHPDPPAMQAKRPPRSCASSAATP